MDEHKKIRILHVLGGLWCGGTETFVMNMFRSIDREKVQFEFLIHENSKAHYDDEVIALGGEIYRIPGREIVGTLKYIIILIRAFQKIKPDVIHAHTMFNAGIVMFAGFIAGIKKRVCHAHSTADQFENSYQRILFRSIMRFFILIFSTDLASCGSEAAKYLYRKKKYKTHIFNNAINLDCFKFNENIRGEIRDELDLSDKLVLGHVGRFIYIKNHHFLIEIFKHFHKGYPNSILLLIGDGPLRPELEKKVVELGLSSSVKFLGIRNDIPKLMQGMDLFVFPSIFEGLPIVMIEAQAAGLACVVSDTITQETDVTGRVKFLSIKNSLDKWAEAILVSSNNHVDTSEMIKNKGYDTFTIAKRLTNFYSEVAVTDS